MVKIVYKNKSVVIILKPIGLSSQPDADSLTDAISETALALSTLGENSVLYPVHRLDKVVSGLLVIARTKSAAAALSSLVSSDGIGKEYFAVVEGKCAGSVMEDYLLKSAALGKATISSPSAKGAKPAVLTAESMATVKSEQGERTLLKITLKTGRFHQIRAQLSSRGCPIVGDKKYGAKDYLCRTPALFAHMLDFTLGEEKILAKELPELSKYPWNLFPEDCYK